MRNKNFLPALLFIGVVLLTGFLFFRGQPEVAEAGTSQNIIGWAWSGNIGLVSMNSRNCDTDNDGKSEGVPSSCPALDTPIPDYGVNIASNGNFSGYAWSNNIGWIRFDPAGPYPASPAYSVKMDTVTGVISGWARALANGGGWDGWIKLDGLSVNASNGNFSGYAWGSDVIGWLSFSGVNYQTQTTFHFNAAPVVSDLSVEQGDYCSFPLHPILHWVFSDADSAGYGDYQDAYNVQIDDDSNVAVAPLADTCLPAPGTCSSGHTASSYAPLISFSYNSTYYWRVKAADNNSAWSSWSAVASFTTPIHAFPDPDFSTVSQKISKDEFVQFCSTLQAGVCASNVSLCYNSSGGTISCSGETFLWTFPSGTQFSTTTSATSENPKVKFSSSGPQTVSLSITDDAGTCSVTKNITVSKPLPKWKEVAP
ncbi:MAG: hypothetical protein PHU56_03525 [Candidatus Pacebacteria bacterium]|nr:hypothetical protein [Candidatus Paceibacterota bacterium]